MITGSINCIKNIDYINNKNKEVITPNKTFNSDEKKDSFISRTSNISFKSWHKTTRKSFLAKLWDKIINPKKTTNVKEYYKHHTYLFRDFHTLEFVKDYLKKHFPEGTHIADFACSNGEETCTIAMILDNPKYKITGYDIVKDAIKQAKKGEYHILTYDDPPSLSDEHLIKRDLSAIKFRDANEEALLKGYWKKFDKFFINNGKKLTVDYRDEEYPYKRYATVFQAKKELFREMILDYKIGDICNIGKIDFGENKPGAVVLKNGWYHLHGNKEENLGIVRKVAVDIHSILPDNGLLVCGSLMDDHKFWETPAKGSTYLTSPFHEELRKAGFEPVFNDIAEGNYGYKFWVPSVWKKVGIQ